MLNILSRALSVIFGAFYLLGVIVFPLNAGAVDKQIIGQVETIALGKKRALFSAKIDTGADTSSLHAQNVELYRVNNVPWVKFRIQNKYGKVFLFKKKIVRMAIVKQKSAPDQSRPVVNLQICLGKVLKTVDVNLVDRANFKYAFLIGRSFLSGDFLVDVDKSFSIEPNCGQH